MSSVPTEFDIRRITELEELHDVEELQRKVWNFGPEDLVPARLMRVSSRSGTLVLGAYDSRQSMVGFAYGFPGIREGKLVFCSHMLAVLPEIRNRSLGRDLKLAQRSWLLPQPVDLMTWTFDPLEVKNGYLNLSKLGAVAGEYIENLYGKTSSPLHGGLDTDRFFVHWHLRSDRVKRRIDPEVNTAIKSWERLNQVGVDRCLNQTIEGPGGVRLCREVSLSRDEPELLVEAPFDAKPLRTDLVEEGRHWQQEIRRMFQTYFERGYVLTDVLKNDERRCYYLLEADPAIA